MALATSAASAGSSDKKSMTMTRDFSTAKHLQAVVIGVEHALLRRHSPRILDQSEHAEHGLDRRNAVDRRIEFRPVAELEPVDHFAREIARQHKLHLAGHRLRVGSGAAVHLILVGLRPQEDVVATFDQDARFAEIFGGARPVLSGRSAGRADRAAAARFPPARRPDDLSVQLRRASEFPVTGTTRSAPRSPSTTPAR